MPDAPPLDVSVLGPIAVRDALGADVTPTGTLQRRLLALFVLRRGNVVSSDAAIDVLWPDAPPRDPVASLQNHLFRLRRELPATLIESVAGGYRLDPAAIDLDVDRLERLLAGPPDQAIADQLDDLVRRWHGPAYPELGNTDAGLVEATRLDELRVRARELLVERRLGLGDAGAAIAELTALADEHPLRERPRSLLMAALAASGRGAEALRVYDDFRRLLGSDLGIEPSPELAAQHAALLAGELPSGRDRPTTRIPLPVTDLVGRETLLAQLHALVRHSRLVTLVGPGGVGKTRLLVELGQHLRAAHPDRPVVWCELAQAEPTTAIEFVASACGIDSRPGVAPLGRIVDVLGTSELVLLLDNCEHVLGAAAELARALLADCPGVTLLATSRERLRISGEQVCPIPPLAIGADDAAAELFVRRALAVRPDMSLDADQRACIGEIVGRLDGLPLAIELAAARLHTHELVEVASGLDRPLALLSAGDRTSQRHSSLAAVVSWSYGLLEPELQRVLSAVSVFLRPFTLTDAAAVCGLAADAIAEALARLVEQSLVTRAPGGRYALLETLRAYAAERLGASGDAEQVGRHHARRLVDWATESAGRMHSPGDLVIAECDDAVPELHTALTWLLDRNELADAAHLVAPLTTYGLMRLRPDVLRWAELVLDADPDGRATGVASHLWTAAAYYSWMAGDLAEAARRADRAVDLAGSEPGGVSQKVATIRGNMDLFTGRLSEAADWYRRGVAAAQDDVERLIAAGAELLAIGYAATPEAPAMADRLVGEVGDADSPVGAYVWYCAGEATMAVDTELARERLARAVDLATVTNTAFVRGVAGASKASIESRTGDPAAAAADYAWLIPHWRRAGMWPTQWTMLRSIVGLLERLGRAREAAVLEGAVRSPSAGHRIFGADEQALREIGDRLRSALGDEAYESARREGAELDGDGAAELALRCL